MSISVAWEPLATRGLRTVLPVLAPIGVAVAYFAGAQAAFAIGTLTQQFAPFWPPNVLLLCAFLVTPRRQWPFFIAAAFPAHVLAERSMAMPALQLIAAFGCNVAVTLLNATVMTRLLRGPARFNSLRSTSLYLFFAVIVNPAVIACAAGVEPTLGDGALSDYGQFWWRWYLSNALGNLTLTPLFLAWAPDMLQRVVSPLSSRRLAEALLLALGLAISCAFAFGLWPTIAARDFFLPLLYLPIPFLLAFAVRFGAKGASVAVFIFTLAALIRAMHGPELFVGNPSGYSVLSVQLFLAVTAIPVILLATLVEELQRANRRLSAVLDGISDCYFTLDRDGMVTAANTKGAAWWGTGSDDGPIGRHFSEIIGEHTPETSWLRQTMRNRLPARVEIASNQRRVDIHAYPTADGLSLFYHDITERCVAETAARTTQTLLQSSLDALTSRIAILNGTGRIISANTAWRHRATKFSASRESYVVGSNYLEVCEGGREHEQMIACGLRRLIRGELDEFRHEYPCEFLADSWFQVRGTRFGSGAELRVVVAHENISDVKRSEDALRRLTGRLMRLQDKARREIARELHDLTAQNLLGAMLGIGQALKIAPKLKASAKAALEESRALIDQSQREIRTVSYLLHPPMLDEAGLPAALRWLSDGFAKRTDIRVELDIEADFNRLPAEIETALFRIAQEALTNVHRHSGSQTARISMRRAASPLGESSVFMAIEDDGQGMPGRVAERTATPADERRLGIGLTGMRERLHELGGYLEIRSSPHGTEIRATVPLKAARSVAMLVGKRATDQVRNNT